MGLDLKARIQTFKASDFDPNQIAYIHMFYFSFFKKPMIYNAVGPYDYVMWRFAYFEKLCSRQQFVNNFDRNQIFT